MPNSDIIPQMEKLPKNTSRDITSEQVINQLSGSQDFSRKTAGRLIDSLNSRFSDPISVESEEFHTWINRQGIYARRIIASAIVGSLKDQLTGFSSGYKQIYTHSPEQNPD